MSQSPAATRDEGGEAGPGRRPGRAGRLLEVLDRRPTMVAAAFGCAYGPFTLLGYGNDIDVANVLRAGNSWLDGHYELSRRPGSTPTELVSALADRLGGSVLVNVFSLGFAVLALACLGRILARDRSPHPALATAVLGANPWFWVAATSLGDFTWALGATLAGVDAAQRRRRWVAGAWFGLAVGARASSILLVAAWLVAERTGSRSAPCRPSWAASARTAGLAGAVAAVCFVPPWLDAGGVSIFESGLEPVGPIGQLGRWGIKNLAVIGVAGAVVVAAGAPRWVEATGRWRESVAVRFAVLGLLASEALFARLPLKPVHLLPALACGALLAGAARRQSPRYLAVLVAAVAVQAGVAVRVAEPDVVDAADSGRFTPALVSGVLVSDVRCRLDDRDRGPWPDFSDAEQRAVAQRRAEAAFGCQQRSWRGSP